MAKMSGPASPWPGSAIGILTMAAASAMNCCFAYCERRRREEVELYVRSSAYRTQRFDGDLPILRWTSFLAQRQRA